MATYFQIGQNSPDMAQSWPKIIQKPTKIVQKYPISGKSCQHKKNQPITWTTVLNFDYFWYFRPGLSFFNIQIRHLSPNQDDDEAVTAPKYNMK